MKKRILSALLATIMLFGMMPMVTFAQAEEMPMLTTTYVNPVYDSVLSPEEISIDVSSPAMLSAPVYHTDPSTTAAEMRAALESRAAEVTIGYQIPKNSFNEETLGEITDGIFEAAFAHTGVPTQGDYLKWHFAYCGISAMSSGTNLDGTIWYTDLTFHLEYYTTQEQEEVVAARVDSLLAELNPTGTDYEKIKTVYDWMCENIVYDYANLNDPTYDLKYSAYAALINGTSVCQGYSNLLYRLALEMGIDCRIITGWGNGGNHAWNIIKLGDSYYNLDATWDSTFAQAGRKNQFFLRSEANFGDHVRSPECDTAAFHAAYPMGKTDYDPKQNVVEDENIIASGTCGENLTWVLDTEGTLTISGTGAMENYREGYRQTDSPWYDYREVITNVVIANGVTTIGAYAFYECTNLANVTIGNGVTNIGAWAFSFCSSLTSLELPDCVTNIGGYAFSYCSSLTSITIPESVTDIQDCAFQECGSLTSVTIPEGITWIGKSLFYNCDSLTSITIPTSVEMICYSAFSSCDSLTSIVIPANMAIVENWAFAECTSLSEITFLGDAPEIGEDVFLEVTATAYYPANNPTWTADVMQNYGGIITWTPVGGEPDVDENIIASGTCDEFLTWTLDAEGTLTISGAGNMNTDYPAPWNDYREQIQTVVIEDGITSIGNYAFPGCSNLTNITIADSVKSIGEYAFHQCSKLTNVVLPEGMTTIGNSVFYECSSLTSVTIPNGVKSIDWWAFADCVSLTNIDLSDSLTSIGYRAFSGCTGLTDVIIPTGVTSIGADAFRGCINIENITIPNSVADIGDSAFYECASLTSITIPSGVTSIGSHTFCKCSNLENVVIAEGVEKIGQYAFTLCKNLTNVTIPGSVTEIGQYAFSDCSSLKGIVIPESVSTIGDGAFLKCKSLNSIVIPDGVTAIGEGMFEECYELINVDLPDSITSIGDVAFYRCNITDIHIPDGVTTIGNQAFMQCGNLTSIRIPNSVTSIGDFAFLDCDSLISATISASVMTIGLQAFENCENLWHILYTGTEEQWNTITLGNENDGLLNVTRHYNAKGDEVIAVNKTTCTEKIFCECTICGAVLAETIEGGAHTWDNGVVTKEPTEETVGVRTYTCVTCGETKTEEIPALEHTHRYGSVVTAPSCIEGGYTIYTCSCGDSYVDDHVDPSHHYAPNVTFPEGTVKGHTDYTCSACADSYQTAWLDPAAYEGLTLVCIGDSITCGVGVTADQNDYVYLLAQHLGMDYIRLGVSGTTLCTGGHRTCNISKLTEGNLAGADVVTILMGINDFDQARDGYYTLGDIHSTDTSTVYGAARMWCEQIAELRQLDSMNGTQFYFVTPVITSWNDSVSSVRNWDQSKTTVHGYTLRDMCNAIMEVCALYDVPVIDLNLTSGMYYVSAEDNNTEQFGGDGIHPGALGHEMMAKAMCNALLQNDLRDDHTHTYGSWIVTEYPDCEDGEEKRVCSVCSATESRALNGADHEYACAVDTAPTTDTEGALRVRCLNCDLQDTVVLPKLNKTEYTYEVTKQPTTGETGIGRYTWTVTEFGEYAFEVTLEMLPEVALGDVNGDDKITVLDLMRLANFFAGKDVEISDAAADVNGDGKITVLDLMRLANYFAGKTQLG